MRQPLTLDQIAAKCQSSGATPAPLFPQRAPAYLY